MTQASSFNVVQALNRVSRSNPFKLRSLGLPPAHLATNEEMLLRVTGKAHDVLFMARTVFPFDLFPDSVTIDREKLTITQRVFFFTAKVISVPVRDILSVEVAYGPFFGSVHMTSRYFATNPYSINFLWRSDAMKLQKLLQGYIIAHEREIDCSEIDKAELINLLDSLGEGAPA